MHSGSFRRRTSWLLALVLIPPFIFFFHTLTHSPTGSGGTAGSVFGRPIRWDTFQQHKRWVQRLWEQQFGGQLPEGIDSLITQDTWDRLAILEEAKRKQLQIDDQALASFIQNIPTFQQEGRFSLPRYRLFLSSMGTSPQQFEDFLRQDILIQKLLDQVKAQVTFLDEEIRQAYQQANEKLKARLIRIDPENFSEQVAGVVTEQDLTTHYNAHPELIRVPQQLTFDVLRLTRAQIVEKLSLTEEDLRRYYDDHSEEFIPKTEQQEQKTPPAFEQVRELAHERLVNQKTKQRLRELSLDLQDALNAKWTLEEMAAIYNLSLETIGPIAGESSGIEQGLEPEVMESAAFLEPGRLSDLIETENGVYLTRLSHRQPPRVPPFNEVSETIRNDLVKQRARQQAQSWATQLREQLVSKRAQGLTFEEACLVLGVTATQPDPFTRKDTIEDLGYVPDVNTAAFATAVGAITDVLETNDGFVFLFIEERQPPDEAGLTEELKTQLRQQVLSQKQQTHLTDWLKNLRTRAQIKNLIDNTVNDPLQS